MLQSLPSGTTAPWGSLHIQNTGQDVNVDFPVAIVCLFLFIALLP